MKEEYRVWRKSTEYEGKSTEYGGREQSMEAENRVWRKSTEYEGREQSMKEEKRV